LCCAYRLFCPLGYAPRQPIKEAELWRAHSLTPTQKCKFRHSQTTKTYQHCLPYFHRGCRICASTCGKCTLSTFFHIFLLCVQLLSLCHCAWEPLLVHIFSHSSLLVQVAEPVPLRVGTFVGAHFSTFLFACADAEPVPLRVGTFVCAHFSTFLSLLVQVLSLRNCVEISDRSCYALAAYCTKLQVRILLRAMCANHRMLSIASLNLRFQLCK